jgi:hypothetical protein
LTKEEGLSNEAEGRLASRTTGHSAEDNAGVTDADHDMRKES